MKNIFKKAIIAFGLTIAMGTQLEMKTWEYALWGIIMYFMLSWFFLIWKKLGDLDFVLKFFISFAGTGLILVGIPELWDALLPDNGLRLFLRAITLLILLIIPTIFDLMQANT